MKGLVINAYWLGALITYTGCIFFLDSLDVIVSMIGWFIIPQVFRFRVNEEKKDLDDMDR